MAIAVRLVTVGLTAHRSPSTNISLLGTPLSAGTDSQDDDDDDFREHVTLLHVGFFVAFGERVGGLLLAQLPLILLLSSAVSFLPSASFVRSIDISRE